MPKAIRLKILPAFDPGTTRTVIDYEGPGTSSMAGHDSAVNDIDMYCGQCGALLVTGMPRRNVANFVIRCKLCRAFNDPGDTSEH